MKRALIVLVCLAAVAIPLHATLYVDEFGADIRILDSGEVSIVERLTVKFLTPHHGIEREIPISYRVPATGENLTIGFRLDSVRFDGGPVPVLSKRSGRNQYLRIGDPDRTVTGTHVYEIAYTVWRVLLFHEDYLQFYWNVTGNDWRIPIYAASASIALPSSVPMDQVSSTSYSGYSATSARGGPGTVTSQNQLRFETGRLNPGEGLTVDLAIPREALPIRPPSFTQRLGWFIAANKYAALPIVTLLIMGFLWFRVGRDPRKGIVAPAFEPPRGVGPGDAGVLIDDRIDLRDISAMVVGLAVKGRITIREQVPDDTSMKDKVRTFLGRPPEMDYLFERRSRSEEGLSKAEKVLLGALFDGQESGTRTLSSLQSVFYKHLPEIKLRLYEGLIDKGLYPHNPERTRTFYLNIGLIGIAAGVALGFFFASLYLGLAVAISGLVVLAFSPIMPRKTKKGVEAYTELLGLEEYIRQAEVERIEFHDAPKKSPEVFEKLLPYAMALNLTSIWVHQFEGLLEQPPDWYVGASSFHGPFFALSLMRLGTGMERTFATVPRTATSHRSAWGGGSSFGGGFSGGGFGGGGGGGW